MNISSECNQLKKIYQNESMLVKVISTVLFTLAVSSIASLSSKIVEWTGFVLDGLNFYNSFYVTNVIEFFLWLGLTYSQAEIHIVTLLSIAVISGMKALANSQVALFKEINRKFDTNHKPNLFIYWFMAIFFPLATWLGYGLTNPVIHIWKTILLVVFYPLVMWLAQKAVLKFRSQPNQITNFSYIKTYYQDVLTLFLCVGILAAINSGIDKGINQNVKPISESAPVLSSKNEDMGSESEGSPRI